MINLPVDPEYEEYERNNENNEDSEECAHYRVPRIVLTATK
jgi:hypothetical protein